MILSIIPMIMMLSVSVSISMLIKVTMMSIMSPTNTHDAYDGGDIHYHNPVYADVQTCHYSVFQLHDDASHAYYYVLPSLP